MSSPLTVLITKPASGASLTGVTQVTATYSGQNFEIATVTIDGQQLASDSTKPIAFTIDTARVPDGPHTLTVAVRYRTASGVHRWQKTAIPITTEGNDMNVDITTNKGTSNLSGTVVVTAVVTPDSQALTPVQCGFYIDGQLQVTDTTYPLSFSWDTTQVGDGSHTLRAVVSVAKKTRPAAPPDITTREMSLPVTVKNVASPPPPPPIQDPPANVTAPAITGTATQGQTLTVSLGTWTNSPTSYTRQWVRCDAAGANPADISAATGTSYILTAADVGKTIRCSVVAYNAVGPSAVEVTTQTGVVAALAPAVPANTSLPVITGTAVRLSQLSVSTGSWTNAPTSYTYQWQRGDVNAANWNNIAGATSPFNTLGTGDVGSTLRCAVVAVNASGSSAAATTAATAVVTDLPTTQWFPDAWFSGPSDNAIFKQAMPPKQGVLVGIWRNPSGDFAGVTTRETQSGRVFDIGAVSYFDGTLPNPSQINTNVLSKGKIPLLDAGKYNSPSGQGMQQLINGAYDSFIAQWVQAASNCNPGGPVFIRQFHEYAGTWYDMHYYTRNPDVACTPAQWQAMCRKPVDIANGLGIRNLIWLWCPRPYAAEGDYQHCFDSYPGDSYVDVIAHNGYAHALSFYIHCGASMLHPFWHIFNSSDYVAGCPSMYDHYPDKPYIVTETGCGAVVGNANKGTWIGNLVSDVQAHLSPRMIGLIYSDYVVGTDDWRFDQPGSAGLTAWRAVVNDSYFNTRG